MKPSCSGCNLLQRRSSWYNGALTRKKNYHAFCTKKSIAEELPCHCTPHEAQSRALEEWNTKTLKGCHPRERVWCDSAYLYCIITRWIIENAWTTSIEFPISRYVVTFDMKTNQWQFQYQEENVKQFFTEEIIVAINMWYHRTIRHELVMTSTCIASCSLSRNKAPLTTLENFVPCIYEHLPPRLSRHAGIIVHFHDYEVVRNLATHRVVVRVESQYLLVIHFDRCVCTVLQNLFENGLSR